MEHGAKTYPKQMCFYMCNPCKSAWPTCPFMRFWNYFLLYSVGSFLVGGFMIQTHFKNISQIGSSPQIGVNI